MNRTRLLYRVALAGSLLLLVAAGVSSVAFTSLNWALALGLFGVVAMGVSSHLRLRIQNAGTKRLTASLASLQQEVSGTSELLAQHEAVLAEQFRGLKQENLLSLQRSQQLAHGVESLSRIVSGSSESLAKLSEDLRGRHTGLVTSVHEARETAVESSHRAELTHEALRKQLIQINNLIEQLPSTTGEYTALRNHLADPDAAMPQLGSWALTSPVVVAIAREILNADRPSTVVELGSGASSSWVGLALRASTAGGQAISLDHLEEYADGTRRNLRKLQVDDRVTVIDAPLESIALKEERFDWYSLNDFPNNLDPITLLVIDGPPARKGRQTRYPAFPILRDRLAPGASVILDDTVREEEVDIYERWIRENPGLTREADLGKATVLRWNPPA